VIGGHVGVALLACCIALLHGGCRYGYQLLPEGLAGAGAGESGGGASSHAGGSDAGGVSVDDGGAGGQVTGGDGGAVASPAGSGGQGGADSLAGDGGMAAGGAPDGSLPALPCANPLVWRTDFSSDPTALDLNGDAKPDWIIRGGAPFVTAELAAGVWRPTTSKALDTFPPVNFTGRTQARVKMRDTKQTAAATSFGYGGALFWINLDYQASDFLPVYSSITTQDGQSYALGVFARTNGPTATLAGPYSVAKDAFVVLELDFDPASGVVAAWVDGTSLPLAVPSRQTVLNQDQFATAIAPEGTGEFDELWVATCVP
jgi:hypothetical protein